MTDEDKAGGRQIRPFADALREMGRGSTHSELSEGLQQLVAHVREIGKKGTLQLTITVSPDSKNGDTGLLWVDDRIVLKLPEAKRPSSVFYADADGNLTRDNPNQMSFESLRDVSSPATTTQPNGLREAQ